MLRQFESPLVLILVFGALVALFVREWVNVSIILLVVLGSALLGFVQEYRASVAVAQLGRRLALTAQVLRDGAAQTVPASSIVPGTANCIACGNR